MSAAHTPGPWEREKGAGRGAWIKGRSGEWAALACGGNDETAEANARMIAAAPDLLDVARLTLRTILDEAERTGYETPADTMLVAELEAVIAKATTAVGPNSVGTPEGVNQK